MLIRDDYYSRPEISISDINNYIYGGAAYYKKLKDFELSKERTKAMGFGDVLHTYVLEPDRFNEKFSFRPSVEPPPMMRKFCAYKHAGYSDEEAWLRSGYKRNLGIILESFSDTLVQDYYERIGKLEKPTVKPAEIELAKRMKDALLSHSVVRGLLETLKPKEVEAPIFWKYRTTVHSDIDFEVEADCKAKPDLVIHDDYDCIVDLKTTSKPARQFADSYELYKYYRQAAYYLDGVFELQEDHNKRRQQFLFVVVEKQEPFSVKVFEPDHKDLALGRHEYTKALNELIGHRDSESWKDAERIETVSLKIA